MSVVPWSAKTPKSPLDSTDELLLFTGVRQGLALSVASDTTFNVAEGEAIIVDKDPNPLLTVVTKITKAAENGITDTNLGEALSHIFMDSAGTITIETTPPMSIDDVFDKIYLGALLHVSSVIVAAVPDPIVAQGSSSTEIVELVFGGGTKLTGSILTGNADLTLDITAGILRQASTPVVQADFFLVYINGGGQLIGDNSSNVLDPTQINEDGLGTLVAISPANDFSIIRVFQAGITNDLIFYYGTEQFATIADALVAPEPLWVEHEDTRDISPIAKIFIRADVTDIAAGIAAGTVIIQAITSRTQL